MCHTQVSMEMLAIHTDISVSQAAYITGGGVNGMSGTIVLSIDIYIPGASTSTDRMSIGT